MNHRLSRRSFRLCNTRWHLRLQYVPDHLDHLWYSLTVLSKDNSTSRIKKLVKSSPPSILVSLPRLLAAIFPSADSNCLKTTSNAQLSTHQDPPLRLEKSDPSAVEVDLIDEKHVVY